ncbi:MAG: hypothetical protein ACI9BD_000626, partial [Candidatus Marinamargulisbacteria bacterium]
RMRTENPNLSIKFHEFVVARLSDRLVHANKIVSEL